MAERKRSRTPTIAPRICETSPITPRAWWQLPTTWPTAFAEQIRSIAHTGLAGDGKIFVIDLEQAVRIGSGERGELALK